MAQLQVAVLLWLCAASFLEGVEDSAFVTSNVISDASADIQLSDKEALDGEGKKVSEEEATEGEAGEEGHQVKCDNGVTAEFVTPLSKPAGRAWKKIQGKTSADHTSKMEPGSSSATLAWQSTLEVSQEDVNTLDPAAADDNFEEEMPEEMPEASELQLHQSQISQHNVSASPDGNLACRCKRAANLKGTTPHGFFADGKTEKNCWVCCETEEIPMGLLVHVHTVTQDLNTLEKASHCFHQKTSLVWITNAATKKTSGQVVYLPGKLPGINMGPEKLPDYCPTMAPGWGPEGYESAGVC